MSAQDRLPIPPGARTPPARFYIDPGLYRDEIERFFCRGWFHAGRADQIPKRGNYVLREIAGESLILVRDGAGEDSSGGDIHAFFNVCRHRGTRLCTAAEGTYPGTIQCPYHAWTFDLAGRLVGAPHMEGIPGFRKEDYPLRRARMSLWEGHIFLNLADEPEPLDARLGAARDRFRPWGMADLRLGARIIYDVAANWKLILQNYSECLHCPVIHPALQRLSHYLNSVSDTPTPACLGGWMGLREGVETLSRDGKRRRAYLPGLGADERRRVYYYAILPNLLLSLHPDYMLTHTLWPRACDRTKVVCEWHFHPDAMAQPGFDASDAVEFWDMTNRQDWHVCELSQLGLASRAYTPGPYADREDLLAELDRMILHLGAGPGEPPARP